MSSHNGSIGDNELKNTHPILFKISKQNDKIHPYLNSHNPPFSSQLLKSKLWQLLTLRFLQWPSGFTQGGSLMLVPAASTICRRTTSDEAPAIGSWLPSFCKCKHITYIECIYACHGVKWLLPSPRRHIAAEVSCSNSSLSHCVPPVGTTLRQIWSPTPLLHNFVNTRRINAIQKYHFVFRVTGSGSDHYTSVFITLILEIPAKRCQQYSVSIWNDY